MILELRCVLERCCGPIPLDGIEIHVVQHFQKHDATFPHSETALSLKAQRSPPLA